MLICFVQEAFYHNIVFIPQGGISHVLQSTFYKAETSSILQTFSLIYARSQKDDLLCYSIWPT